MLCMKMCAKVLPKELFYISSLTHAHTPFHFWNTFENSKHLKTTKGFSRRCLFCNEKCEGDRRLILNVSAFKNIK